MCVYISFIFTLLFVLEILMVNDFESIFRSLIIFSLFFFLGLDAELYYVRNDLVSHYALSFNLLVPSETNFLHFTWHAKSKVRVWSTKDAKLAPPRPRAEARAVSTQRGSGWRAVAVLDPFRFLF